MDNTARKSPVPRGAAPFVPSDPFDVDVLRQASQACRGCKLYRAATQAVFGEGPGAAKILLIGEQPGNEEDRQGHPFVGPAGKLLDQALQQAGISRDAVYVTNAVKHFKFEERGKRRIHKKPRASEVQACRPWLDEEIRLIRPKVIVCLGATAAQSLFGSAFRVTERRGVPLPFAEGSTALATIHPSAILRIADQAARHAELARLVEDLKKALQLSKVP